MFQNFVNINFENKIFEYNFEKKNFEYNFGSKMIFWTRNLIKGIRSIHF